ncbi:Cytochrome P450 [Aeromicrobium choanae]|uniref:Cytochrome P450 n=1 Tax=Aeromicrobium choanae TaxID=1736691 RepID=A0A1T4YNL6_9ACTN|nr:Cytochrome P450 [Aeromicrobium choanae]
MRVRLLRGIRSKLVSSVARRHVAKRGIDLASFSFIPEPTKAPLQRVGLDPVPEMARIRSEEPLHRLDLPFDFTAYLVTGYEEGRQVLTARDTYSTDIRHLFSGDGPATSDDIGGLGFTDPPVHTRLRKIITPEFTMRRLARLEPMIEQIVDRSLDDLEAAGPHADLAKTFAFPIPFNTICALLGLDYEDTQAFSKLGSARFDATNGGAAAFGAVSEQREFLFDAVARQRKEPGPGLIGQIIRDEGDLISDRDLAGLADGVFTGGYETTAGMIALSTIMLSRDRAYADLVRSGNRETLDRVIEELLRYFSVVQVAFPRFAKQDMELFGTQVKAGDVLLVSLSTSNRDESSAGAGADAFDPLRIPTSGHLAFGHGIHRCIGAELARMELRIALPKLLRRFPDLHLSVPESELEFRQLSFVFGIESLPVTLA